MGALDLEGRLVFYGSYHSNPGNIALHMIGVPLIASTTLLLAANTPALPLPLALPQQLQPLLAHFPPTLGTAGALFYVTTYILLDPLAGGLLAPVTLSLTAACHALAQTYGAAASYVAFAVWVAAWAVQFVGHGAFEKRAPALLDDFFGAIVLAPFFVWFECLFFCGYRRGLRERVRKGVERRLEVFREDEARKVGRGKGARKQEVDVKRGEENGRGKEGGAVGK